MRIPHPHCGICGRFMRAVWDPSTGGWMCPSVYYSPETGWEHD